MKFKKGMKVTKVYKGLSNYTEKSDEVVAKVSTKDNTVWLANCGDVNDPETGITYDLKGKEKENFFFGITSFIVPAQDKK